jgi:hypothetical protein
MELIAKNSITERVVFTGITIAASEWEEGETYEEREQRKAVAALDRVHTKAAPRPEFTYERPSATL